MLKDKSDLLSGILKKLRSELFPIHIKAVHPINNKLIWAGVISKNFSGREKFVFPKFPHAVLLEFEFPNGDICFEPCSK
jgi:hypothetical protein